MTAVTVSSLTVAPERRDTSLSGADHGAWARRHVQPLLSSDLLAFALAAGLGLGMRFGFGAYASVGGIPYTSVTLLAIPIWVGALALSRCYSPRLVGPGSGELRRVFVTSLRLAGIVAI